jgi:hypothetical protein
MILRRCSRMLPLLALLAVVPCRAAEPATQPAVPDSFMRFVDDDHGGGSLQTADVAFRNPAGVTVHLVAAVHIGEKSYYDRLNRDFKNYDAVLYELVNTKGAAPPVAGDAEKSSNPISEFQVFLKKFLDLDFQLDDIDYTAANFVHADMDKDTFEKMQEERGESFEQIMLRQLIRALTNPPTTQPAAADEDDADDDLITMLTRPDGERQMKVVIARQMGQMDLSAMGLDGPGGSVIVTERNKAALKVLSDSMAAGKKNMAIFYGAAHMPDMTKRLEAMGFSPVSTQWNLAWDLTIRANQPSLMEKMMRNLADSVKSNN